MKQQTFSDVGYSGRSRMTKREDFLNYMNETISWEEWIAWFSHIALGGSVDAPPKGIEKMLWMYLLQRWFTLSDEGVEHTI